MRFPIFEVPFQIVCSKKLTSEEKLVVGSFYTWQLREIQQDFKKIAAIIAMDLNVLHFFMISLSKKGVIEFNWEEQWCRLLDPDWLYEDVERFVCNGMTITDYDEVA